MWVVGTKEKGEQAWTWRIWEASEKVKNHWSYEESRRESYLLSHTNAFGHFPKGNVKMLKCLKQSN